MLRTANLIRYTGMFIHHNYHHNRCHHQNRHHHQINIITVIIITLPSSLLREGSLTIINSNNI